MKGIILYTSRTSSTRKCANLLKEKLGFTTVDLRKNKVDITNYDIVILGTFVRMGMIDRVMKKFINENKTKLLTKKCGYFICCGSPKNIDKYYCTNYPEELLETSVIKEVFGSSINLNEVKGLAKFILSAATKGPNAEMKNELLDKNIDNFISTIGSLKK